MNESKQEKRDNRKATCQLLVELTAEKLQKEGKIGAHDTFFIAKVKELAERIEMDPMPTDIEIIATCMDLDYHIDSEDDNTIYFAKNK